MCWFYVGIAQIALDPNSVKQANVEKIAPNHPSKPLQLHPPYTGNAHIEATHLKKGASLNPTSLHYIRDSKSDVLQKKKAF